MIFQANIFQVRLGSHFSGQSTLCVVEKEQKTQAFSQISANSKSFRNRCKFLKELEKLELSCKCEIIKIEEKVTHNVYFSHISLPTAEQCKVNFLTFCFIFSR